MEKKITKKDAGTIFNPAMFLMIMILTVQLLTLFLEYKRIAWVSTAVTDTMTDALRGACTLNEEELYLFGSTNDLEIRDPEEKYTLFQKILCEELGLTEDMQVTDRSFGLLKDRVRIKDFRVYSVGGGDITFYDFDESAAYTVTELTGAAGSHDIGNGKVIEETTLMAEIGFTVTFLGLPVEVSKYHIVDVKN